MSGARLQSWLPLFVTLGMAVGGALMYACASVQPQGPDVMIVDRYALSTQFAPVASAAGSAFARLGGIEISRSDSRARFRAYEDGQGGSSTELTLRESDPCTLVVSQLIAADT